MPFRGIPRQIKNWRDASSYYWEAELSKRKKTVENGGKNYHKIESSTAQKLDLLISSGLAWFQSFSYVLSNHGNQPGYEMLHRNHHFYHLPTIKYFMKNILTCFNLGSYIVLSWSSIVFPFSSEKHHTRWLILEILKHEFSRLRNGTCKIAEKVQVYKVIKLSWKMMHWS